MPVVDGKKYPYTKAGKAQASRAKKGKASGKGGKNKPNSSSMGAGNMRGGQPKGTK